MEGRRTMKYLDKAKILILISGIFSIIWGLTYMFGMYGPTEREVSEWGLIEAIVGFLVVCTAFFITGQKLIKFILAVFLSINMLLQILPTVLWFIFNGTGISDGSPPSNFVASWIYALPHIAIGVISLISIVLLFRRQKSGSII